MGKEKTNIDGVEVDNNATPYLNDWYRDIGNSVFLKEDDVHKYTGSYNAMIGRTTSNEIKLAVRGDNNLNYGVNTNQLLVILNNHLNEENINIKIKFFFVAKLLLKFLTKICKYSDL